MTRACSQRVKYQYTVSHGGKSAGNARHAHTARTTSRIASTTSRRGCFSGRPPVFAGGSNGSISAHWASVMSEGYRGVRQTITPP